MLVARSAPAAQAVEYKYIWPAFGDSHTYNVTYLPSITDFYPYLGQQALRSQGCLISSRNYGVAGSTTAEMLSLCQRVPVPTFKAFATIYGGVNDDPVTGNTEANLVAIGQALAAQGYTRQIMGIYHYLNFSSGGDTTSAQQPAAAALRAKQLAAAATLGCVVANFYEYERQMILDGEAVQGTYTWLVADFNGHPNAYGEQILAEVIESVIPPEWLEDIQ